ncbi:hypothetical protein BOX15_Mlig027551g1 [Macrostomum lignano]|uniref:MYCBP-associated protein n=2 Tax=Macrostomum lignano TaxID=282301 RepID=A0A267FCZ7_9PLAT|nr:hypothetical protein BOX15_Mlig027551g1 [Macrostomum lignano]
MRRIGLLKRQPPPQAATAAGANQPVTNQAPMVTMVTAPALATGESGPRFDHRGRLIAHSILGSPADYYRLAVAKGRLKPDEVPPEAREEDTVAERNPPINPPQNPPCGPPFPAPAADMAALNNWEMRMAERKRLQGRISKLLDRPVSDLVMNSAEHQRSDIEEKDLISRAIPFYDYGKGYRCGSEFWQQPERIGDAATGIHATPTLIDRGYPPPLERVGLPSAVQVERGGLPTSAAPTAAASSSSVPASPRYPWKRHRQPESYLLARTAQLADVINELEPHRPDFRQLVVVGRGEVGEAEVGRQIGVDRDQLRPTSAVAPSVQGPANVKSPGQPEQKHRVTGPSMLFGGQPARWLGDPHRYRGSPGIEARVFLDSMVGQPTSQYLEFENDGTTVLFYRWRRLEQANPFGLVKPPVRRFYFDTSGGALLPGELMHFPFIFKSNQPGLFTERWRLDTTPSLLGGADLTVTLRGVSLETDGNVEVRAELDNSLAHRRAVRLVDDILKELLNSLPLDGRRRSSFSDDFQDELEAFRLANSNLAVCQLGRRWWQPDAALLTRLRRFYATTVSTGEKARSADDWDLSLSTLRRRLLLLPAASKTSSASSSALSASLAPSAAAAQGVGRLYALVNDRMSFRMDWACCNRRQRSYVLCYRIVLETMDNIFNLWQYQRYMSGLPEIEAEFPDPASRRSRLAGGRRQRQQQTATPSSATSRIGTDSARSSQRSRPVTKDGRMSPKQQLHRHNRLLQQKQQQQQEELLGFNSPDRETADQVCSDKIYAATYCLLVRMVEQVADVCEETTETEP